MPTYIVLLDFITHTMLGEVSRSWSFSLWSFLHSPVTSSRLGSNIIFNTLCKSLSFSLSLSLSLYIYI
jgi:hypothetical protein